MSSKLAIERMCIMTRSLEKRSDQNFDVILYRAQGRGPKSFKKTTPILPPPLHPLEHSGQTEHGYS